MSEARALATPPIIGLHEADVYIEGAKIVLISVHEDALGHRCRSSYGG